MIQLVAAIFVVAGLIWILGAIGAGFDPIGLGIGNGAALRFLCGTICVVAAGGGLYLLGKRKLRGRTVDAMLLAVPVIGPCLRALALTRFCLGLRLTLETGMAVNRACVWPFNPPATAPLLRGSRLCSRPSGKART